VQSAERGVDPPDPHLRDHAGIDSLPEDQRLDMDRGDTSAEGATVQGMHVAGREIV